MNATSIKLMTAALIATAAQASPASARHLRSHGHPRSHAYVHHTAYGIDYAHNYGPGALPGTYAYYDGPLAVRCAQSAAAYRGQDGRRHPCN